MKTADCCEVFCGRGAISKGYEHYGMESHRFDIRLDESFNIHTKQGLVTLGKMMAKTKPHTGNVQVEPTCASWIWLTRGVMLRGVEPCPL